MALTGWQVRQYFDNVHHKAQESRAKADGTTLMKTGKARMIGFPVIDVAEGETPSSRLAPTPNNTPPRTTRWSFPTPWVINLMEDDIDDLEHFWQADSEHVMSAAASNNRMRMGRLLAAALGTALETSEDTIGTAGTSVALPTATQQIVHGSTGLNLAKIIQARTILDAAVGGDVETFGPYYIAYHPNDFRFLANESQLNTLDSVSRQQLMSGQVVNGLLGFNWIPTNQGPSDGTTRSVVAWARSAMGCGLNADPKIRAGERADLSYSTQVFRRDKIGYVRIDDKGVVDIQTTIAATP